MTARYRNIKPGDQLSIMTRQEKIELKEIQDGLVALLVGKKMRLSLIAALSVAATTAHMMGIPKLEAQALFMRMQDERFREAHTQ